MLVGRVRGLEHRVEVGLHRVMGFAERSTLCDRAKTRNSDVGRGVSGAREKWDPGRRPSQRSRPAEVCGAPFGMVGLGPGLHRLGRRALAHGAAINVIMGWQPARHAYRTADRNSRHSWTDVNR